MNRVVNALDTYVNAQSLYPDWGELHIEKIPGSNANKYDHRPFRAGEAIESCSLLLYMSEYPFAAPLRGND